MSPPRATDTGSSRLTPPRGQVQIKKYKKMIVYLVSFTASAFDAYYLIVCIS